MKMAKYKRRTNELGQEFTHVKGYSGRIYSEEEVKLKAEDRAQRWGHTIVRFRAPEPNGDRWVEFFDPDSE